MMAYDTNRGESLIYGGSAGGDNPKSDAWTYDYAENRWTQVTQGEGPGPRENTWVTYDEANDAYVLFGGLGPGLQASGLMGDTWVLRLEGGQGSWTLVGAEPTEEPPTGQPPSGIPGYPLAATTASLALATWALRKRGDK
jgi:hypothetical protein